MGGGVKRNGALLRLLAIRSWFNNLRLASRLLVGFGIAVTVILALALLGTATLYAVNRDVGVFSATADASQTAADIDIGLRSLEIAVRDHLAEGDRSSLDQAEAGRDRVRALLDQLEPALDRPEDQADAATIRGALAAYWTGVERLLELRTERSTLVGEEIDGTVRTLRERLEGLRATGGIDSATLASDIAIALTRMQDHLVRFVERRDAVEGDRMRKELALARDRLSEMNRYLWVPGTRASIAEAETLLTTLATALDRADELLVAEDAVRADQLMPNAAQVTQRAGEIRQRTDAVAGALRSGLSAEAERYLKISLWLGGTVLAFGLGLTAFVAWSVGRPVGAMATAVAALADGHTDVTLPAAVRNDEVGALARAVGALRTRTAEMDRLKRQAESMHADLSAARERAEADSLAKTHFLVNMGHELHGPIADIVARSQSLMTELHRQGFGELANDVEAIQWSGEQLGGLIDSILDYAKIEAGTMDLCLQDFDVPRLLVEVRERTLPVADLNGNILTATALPGAGAMQSDFTKVRQILLNLLDNACAYTQGGSVTLTAERFEQEGRAWLRFTVADDGPGLPAPAGSLGRLFQPFVRGPVGAVRRRGAGLGLTLVAHYADMLGGEITVTSSPGRGTRITVAMPAVYAQEDADRPLHLDTTGEAGPRPMLTASEPAAAAPLG